MIIIIRYLPSCGEPMGKLDHTNFRLKACGIVGIAQRSKQVEGKKLDIRAVDFSCGI